MQTLTRLLSLSKRFRLQLFVVFSAPPYDTFTALLVSFLRLLKCGSGEIEYDFYQENFGVALSQILYVIPNDSIVHIAVQSFWYLLMLINLRYKKFYKEVIQEKLHSIPPK